MIECDNDRARRPRILAGLFGGHSLPLDAEPGARINLSNAQLVQVAQSVVRTRRRREALLGPDLFADPAWDMLLDLYIAEMSGGPLSVSTLAAGAAVPATTALRWMGVLQQHELIWREPDGKDGRRTIIRVAPKAIAAVENMLHHLFDGFLVAHEIGGL
jgi:hypothetical protein